MITEVDKRAVNTLQNMIDNAKIYWTVYEDGDMVVCNIPSPQYLYDDGSVKVTQGLMLWDEEENELYCEGVQKVYEQLVGAMVFDTDMNCTEEQLEQVNRWLEELGVTLE